MKKYIVREVAPEAVDLSWYFDGDCYTEKAGGVKYALFILSHDWRGGLTCQLNGELYDRFLDEAKDLADCFEHVGPYDDFSSYKEAMQYNDVPYSARFCHTLKSLLLDEFDPYDVDDMAKYLSVMTGKPWETMDVRGYCQGDCVTVLFCPEGNERKTAKICGEVWLGCAKEFGVIELDEDGEEADSCYGYIVADCEVRDDEDYKRLVCEWAGINPEDTDLQMIDGYHTYTEYSYRTA